MDGGAARRADGTLAGGTASLLDGVRHLHALGAPLPEALAAASTVPARIARRDDLGRLAVGAPADVVVLDDGSTCGGCSSPARRSRSARARRGPPRMLIAMLEEAVAGDESGASMEAARAALAAGEWELAREAFQASLDEAPSAAAFEGLGVACRWLGEQEAAMRALRRAYRLHRRAGDARGAARVALQLCFGECYFHADVAVGLGWIERAERLLEGTEPGPEQGWLTLIRGHLALQVDRDPARAAPTRRPRAPSATTAASSTSR